MNVNEALAKAAKYGQVGAMRLLHDEWGARMPATFDMAYLREDVKCLLKQWAIHHSYRAPGAKNVNESFIWAAKYGQVDAMRVLHDVCGATDINEALAVAAGDNRLGVMRLLHKWGAVLPTVPTVSAVPTTDRSPLRKEFFRSVISRLAPVHKDQDHFAMCNDNHGKWRICVGTTNRDDGAWILEADEEKATYWRSGREPDSLYWKGAEPEAISEREQARAIKIVSVFEAYMRETL